MSEKLKGKIVISRPQGGGRERVSITVTDELSRCEAIRIEIDVAEFTDALFSRYVDCTFDLNDTGVIGATAENKSELVPFVSYSTRTRDETNRDEYRTRAAIAALAPFEVDGWRGDARDLYNGHNTVRREDGDFQRVTFRRHLRDGKPI